MWSPLRVLLLCILFCEYGTNAFPSGQTVTEAEADDPGLLEMLDFFKGKSDMGELTAFLRKFKVVKAIGDGMFEVCVPCKETIIDAAKTNVGFRILVKIAEGKAPDIKDMYDLATKGTGNMKESLINARKDKNFIKLNSLVSGISSTQVLSVPVMDNFIDAFTGKNFTLNPALVKEVHDGQIAFTVDNLAQLNLILLYSGLVENQNLSTEIGKALAKRPIDFISLLEYVQRYNTSTLSKIKALNGGINNSKYLVAAGKQVFVTHPGVEKLLNDIRKVQQNLKAKSQDQEKAESLIIDCFSDLTGLIVQVIKDAETSRKISQV